MIIIISVLPFSSRNRDCDDGFLLDHSLPFHSYGLHAAAFVSHEIQDSAREKRASEHEKSGASEYNQHSYESRFEFSRVATACKQQQMARVINLLRAIYYCLLCVLHENISKNLGSTEFTAKYAWHFYHVLEIRGSYRMNREIEEFMKTSHRAIIHESLAFYQGLLQIS